MKLKTTLTAKNRSTETLLVITTRPTRAILTRWEQKAKHDQAVNAAHETLRKEYHARDIRFR